MVTWNNGSGTHNVQFNDGSYEMPADPSGSSWTVSRTFNTPGTFSYICRLHGSSMSGSVIVLPVAPPPPGPPGPPGPAPPGGSAPRRPAPHRGARTHAPAAERHAQGQRLHAAGGKRVRVFGVVRPARDGRKVQIQKRLRNGSFKTIATTRLRDAGRRQVDLQPAAAPVRRHGAARSRGRRRRGRPPASATAASWTCTRPRSLPRVLTPAKLRRFCLDLPGAVEEFPFRPDLSVFKVAGKVFALSPLRQRPLRVSLKCEPALAEQLRDTYPSITPGYHPQQAPLEHDRGRRQRVRPAGARHGRGLLRPGRRGAAEAHPGRSRLAARLSASRARACRRAPSARRPWSRRSPGARRFGSAAR